jgi:hypothetical protein
MEQPRLAFKTLLLSFTWVLNSRQHDQTDEVSLFTNELKLVFFHETSNSKDRRIHPHGTMRFQLARISTSSISASMLSKTALSTDSATRKARTSSVLTCFFILSLTERSSTWKFTTLDRPLTLVAIQFISTILTLSQTRISEVSVSGRPLTEL